MTVSPDDIERAAREIRGQVVRTPLVRAYRLGALLGCELYLKLETLQATGSFKDRGSLYKLLHLPESARTRGVVAMSAGNHAQGVAYHAARLGIPATIVMPSFAPVSKIERTRGYGARVFLHGDTLDVSAHRARELEESEGLTFVHPFDDERIIAGQGSIGLEILEDLPEPDAVLVPVGGGGIMSGIATAIHAKRPETALYGVESDRYPSMSQALRGEEPSFGETTIADGIAVKIPGKLTLPIIRALVREVLLVSEGDFERAVFLLAEEQRLVVEGAGAAGVAALLAHGEIFRGKRVVVVLCGGNIDSRVLASVLSRALLRDERMLRLRIRIVDRAGELARLTRIIAENGSNIMEIHHQRLFADIPAKEADIDAVIETSGRDHGEVIRAKLEAEGYRTRILGSSSGEGGI